MASSGGSGGQQPPFKLSKFISKGMRKKNRESAEAAAQAGPSTASRTSTEALANTQQLGEQERAEFEAAVKKKLAIEVYKQAKVAYDTSVDQEWPDIKELVDEAEIPASHHSMFHFLSFFHLKKVSTIMTKTNVGRTLAELGFPTKSTQRGKKATKPAA